MSRNGENWSDEESTGPFVRPYAMTRGRTRSGAEDGLDVIAMVVAQDRGEDADCCHGAAADRMLSPEHLDIVLLCREVPQSLAELATELDLPVGVVRVLVGDLLDADLVRVARPVPPAELPDESILREVINGLRAL